MTEPTEQSHHQKTSDSPSGGISTGAMEHLPASDGVAPQNGDRGRQRDQKKQQQQRRRAENCGDINTDKLWQMKGGERGVCPASAPGNQLPKCPGAELPQQKPNSGKNGRPLEDTINRQDESSLVDSDTGLDARLGKKKHRRRASRKRRNWKPYYKLSWEERRALEEKETARASRLREEMFAKGLPVAPYNTTQFLMDEHDREEPDLNTETAGQRRPSGDEEPGSEEDCCGGDHDDEEDDDGSGGGGGGSDGIGRAGSAGGEFLQRDFSETYEMYHVESLQNMTKQELVQEYLELEKCMSRLEEENNRLRRAVEPGSGSGGGGASSGAGSPLARLGEMEKELERLRAQNTELLLLKQDREQVASN